MPSPALTEADPAWRAGLAAQDDRAKRLETPEAAREREATRDRYADLTPVEALALARREFTGVFASELYDGETPDSGLRVTDQRGRGTGLVEDERTGARSLLQSSAPLRAAGEAGAPEPVDLSLERSGDALESANALVPIAVDATSPAGVRFPESDVAVEVGGGARSRTGAEVGDRVFFAEVRGDTDAVVVPTVSGAELGLQLRSDDAAESQVLELDLPNGATVERARSSHPIPGEPPRSLVIRDGDRVLGYVAAPNAFDADGRDVPVRLEPRQDGEVGLVVDHQGRDLRYPLFVDPEVSVGGSFHQGWSGWAWSQALREPRNYSVPEGFGAAANDCAYYCGLYLSHPYNRYNANGSYAHWYFRAPPNTFLYRTIFGGLAHDGYDVYGRNHTNSFQGVMNGAYSAYEGMTYINQSGGRGGNPFGPAEHDYWGVTHDFCVNPHTCSRPTSLSEQNYALFGIMTLNKFGCCGLGPAPYQGAVTMAHAHAFLGDRRLPTLAGGVPGDKAWRDDGGGTTALDPVARDDGLGVYSFTLDGPSAGGGTKRVRSPADGRYECTGSPYVLPCPANGQSGSVRYDYRLPEGESRMTVLARDAVDNATGSHTWLERIDRTAPVLAPLTGSAFDARDRPSGEDQRFSGLDEAAYSVRASATDAHAGVREVEVFVGGQSQRARGGYAAGGMLDWTLRPDDYPDGTHTVEVVARDQVAGQAGAPDERHVARRSFTVTVDRRGDVHRAELSDGDPAEADNLAEEWAQLSSRRARHEALGLIETRTSVPCTSAPDQPCGEVRSRSRKSDEDISEADDFSVHRGASDDDARLDAVADLQEVRGEDLGEPTATGPFAEALRPWQQPPPGHAPTYAYHERVTTAEDEEGRPEASTRRLWVDPATRLPYRERIETAGELESETLYTYDRQRQTLEETAPDLFRAAAPDPMGEEENVDYGTSAYQGEPDDPGPDSEPATPAELLEAALRFRRDFGLNTDPAFVQQLIAGTPLFPTTDTYGVDLTGPEAAVIAQRLAVQGELGLVRDYGSQQPASFAGMWIDQENGGIVNVGFTQDAALHLERLRAIFPFPDRLRVYDAQRTLDELTALRERVTDDWDQGTLAGDGLDVVSVAPDEQESVVLVGVENPTPDLAQRLRSRYGDGVRLVADEPGVATRRIPPLTGGLRIERPLGGGRWSTCSAGFAIRAGTRVIRGKRSGAYRMLTAGHCGRPGARYSWRRTPDGKDGRNAGTGRFFGRMLRNPFHPPRRDGRLRTVVDIADIGLRPRYQSSLVRTGPDRFLRIRGQQPRGAGTKNEMVCQFGGTTYSKFGRLQCGKMTHKGLTKKFRERDSGPYDFRARGLNYAETRSLGGDSGGAVFAPGPRGIALGTVTGGSRTGPGMYYTQIAVALDALKDPRLVTHGAQPQGPRAITGAATDLRARSVRLNGSVNGQGYATDYYFEWGRTASYGERTADARLPAGSEPSAVATTLTGLAPNTTYHARLVATSTVGVARGSDITFTTSTGG